MRLILPPLASLILVAAFAASATAQPAVPTTQPETTPHTLPGAETFVFRDLSPEPLRLHVYKPDGWTPADRRPAFVYFFGGGWNRGTPERSGPWARMASRWGMVGVAPDYRTRDRYGTTPFESIADARLAVKWVIDHADELGIDPAKVVVGGNSAGGHLALWTAIDKVPEGSEASESPSRKPAALVLSSPAADTSGERWAARFRGKGEALSATLNLTPNMPPALVFHGDADAVVPYEVATALRDALVAGGGNCELVTVPGGSHNFRTDLPEWRDKTEMKIRDFLVKLKLIDG